MDCRPIALLGGACKLGAVLSHQLAAQGFIPIIIDHRISNGLDIVADEPRARFRETQPSKRETLTVLEECGRQIGPLHGAVLIPEYGEAYLSAVGWRALMAVCIQEPVFVAIHSEKRSGAEYKLDTESMKRFNRVIFKSDHTINTDDESLLDGEKCKILSSMTTFLMSDDSKLIYNQSFVLDF
ncbi:hypothetical protein BZJ19_05130 [Salinivibrio proteolyticus]|uniref:hypothetical protein n=1 Tax=Salinivibrio proteolyticus TaxID=334715 RepID=UPI00084CD256|nr:hypothetical protein [Salinivibrio proteolyticus]ODQ00783.1 hypothetical protein BGK46_05995 [Salinivibrio sp. DV]OOF26509.1 hypothetical protein BZJ19_05130 [Salinivibrio proteolyticus]